MIASARSSALVLLVFLLSGSLDAQSIAPPDPGSPSTSLGASRIPDPDRAVDKTGVFLDSMALLAIEHGIRLAFQPGTRRELRGNFWRDYRRSVHRPINWEDTDP